MALDRILGVECVVSPLVPDGMMILMNKKQTGVGFVMADIVIFFHNDEQKAIAISNPDSILKEIRRFWGLPNG